MPGKRGAEGAPGAKGDKGDRGPKGEPGTPAPQVIGGHIDRETYSLTLIFSDQSRTAPIELRAAFEQFVSDMRHG